MSGQGIARIFAVSCRVKDRESDTKMSNTYSNIMEILKSIDEESKKREQILNADTSIRGDLYRSVIFSNTEKFIPITARDGTTRLMPGNQNFYLFRGQTRDYPSCGSSIYRNSQDQIDIFAARLRQIEFEIVLREHAAVQDIIKSGIHISFAGLAQHYELATEYLDVTADPYVAALSPTRESKSLCSEVRTRCELFSPQNVFPP